MGGVTSKVVRRLPKEKSSWTGSRTPSKPGAAPLGEAKFPLASDTKSRAIEDDGKDPQFMSKLNMLGPVRVDHHMQSTQPTDHAKAMYRSRMQSEVEATNSRATRNRLLASSLSDLFDTRKSVTTTAELESLAARYGIDVGRLQQLCRHFNTPNVGEHTIVRTTDENGEESVTMMARWVDPRL
ncbi:hypothetical protein BKA82DRAFT_992864 [Pisolithus tinctorius]|nr:hypothetical protein BKA82DRAFT_992864 [Pisolithus tinctorius]